MSILDYLREELLTEGLGVVYHATELQEAVSIMKSNCFDLSPVIGSDVEVNLSKGKYYYLSTMRTITGRYMMMPGSTTPKHDVYFELDADALSNTLKSTPVDYWDSDPTFSESEERYLSNDDKVCPADKYIIGIHVFIDKYSLERPEYTKTYLTYLYELNMYSRNVPVYYYTDIQKYLTRKGGVDIDTYLASKGITSDSKFDDLDFRMLSRTKPNRKNNLDYILQFYSGDKIPSETYDILRDTFYYGGGVDSIRAQEFIPELKNIIHSARKSGGVNTSNRENVRKLTDIMKRSKSRTIEDFIKNVFYPDMVKKFNWNK
jgi:hypothetical protein